MGAVLQTGSAKKGNPQMAKPGETSMPKIVASPEVGRSFESSANSGRRVGKQAWGLRPDERLPVGTDLTRNREIKTEKKRTIMITRLNSNEPSTPAPSSPITPAADPLANKEVFLNLLVAQIKNQDPLNPTDSVQFLTQLSQFTQTEQTLGMREDLKQITAAINRLGAAATPP